MGKRALYNRSGQQVLETEYNTPTNSNFLVVIEEGEFISEEFRPLESDLVNNWLEITKQEDNYKKVWGKFSATYIKEKTGPDAKYPDTLRIRNGSFYVENVEFEELLKANAVKSCVRFKFSINTIEILAASAHALSSVCLVKLANCTITASVPQHSF